MASSMIASEVCDDAPQIIDDALLDNLTARAKASPRLRQHMNLHKSYDDPCQRLLNAIEPGSYLKPKCDLSKPRSKLLVALRGSFAFVRFDSSGNVQKIIPFAACIGSNRVATAVDVPPACWCTTLSMAPGSVLLEVRPGPFDPDNLGDFAPWAPDAGTESARDYIRHLEDMARV